MNALRCVRCGYDGALLKEGRAPRCPRCGCDLRERPALTYAEMEGFTQASSSRVLRGGPTEARLIERWLAIVLVALVVIIAASLLMTRELRSFVSPG